TMRLLGRPVPAERAAALARVGAIVGEPRFHRYLTGRENLAVIAAARERQAHDRLGLALERVGVGERARGGLCTYSPGMRARPGAPPAVRSATKTPEGIRVTLRPAPPMTGEDAAADINRVLVEAGLAVHRVEPARASLEERFLEITSRLGVAA